MMKQLFFYSVCIAGVVYAEPQNNQPEIPKELQKQILTPSGTFVTEEELNATNWIIVSNVDKKKYKEKRKKRDEKFQQKTKDNKEKVSAAWEDFMNAILPSGIDASVRSTTLKKYKACVSQAYNNGAARGRGLGQKDGLNDSTSPHEGKFDDVCVLSVQAKISECIATDQQEKVISTLDNSYQKVYEEAAREWYDFGKKEGKGEKKFQRELKSWRQYYNKNNALKIGILAGGSSLLVYRFFTGHSLKVGEFLSLLYNLSNNNIGAAFGNITNLGGSLVVSQDENKTESQGDLDGFLNDPNVTNINNDQYSGS